MPLPDTSRPMYCRHCGGDVEYVLRVGCAVYQCYGCGRCSMDYGYGVLLTTDIIEHATVLAMIGGMAAAVAAAESNPTTKAMLEQARKEA